MIYALHKTSLELLNVCVAKSERLTGIGTKMADKLMSKLSNQRRNRVFATVCEDNLDAQLFFKRIGFMATEIKRGHYWQWCDQDGYVFERYVD